MKDLIFEAREVSKSFGKVAALSGVSMQLERGSILGLIGANGAGKSTLMRILAGALKPDSGQLVLDGELQNMNSMIEAWSAGIGFVSQELSLFPALSIIENLALVPGSRHSSRSGFRDEAKSTLTELGLKLPLDAEVARLSLADQQLVEIARALLQKPRVLILDEPTSALHLHEVERLHNVIRKLRDDGVSIIYISHFLEHLLDVCDAFVVLRDGKRVQVAAKDTRPTIPELVEAMLGDNPGPLEKQKSVTVEDSTRVRLEITGLRTPRGLQISKFIAHSGEVVGIAGHAGAGHEELLAVLFGKAKRIEGEIRLPSGKTPANDPAGAVNAGVAYFPADRKGLGLTLRESVSENISAVRSLVLGRDGFFPDQRRQAEIAQERCERLGIKLASVDQAVGELSGGNQQKVVFARWLEAAPTLLLIDDPMRGVDVNAKRQINEVIQDLLSEPRVIIFSSTDPEDYIMTAHRVIVFVDGRAFCELSGSHITEHNLVAAMNGTAPKGSYVADAY